MTGLYLACFSASRYMAFAEVVEVDRKFSDGELLTNSRSALRWFVILFDRLDVMLPVPFR